MPNNEFLDVIFNKNNELNKKYNHLYKIPPKEKYEESPHIKNNILKPNYFQEADILYLPTSQFGYKYLLVVVDVYDSKCDAEKLKIIDADKVKKALEKIYERKILNKPTILQFDKGREF
jgi:hypothetical protein